MTYIDAAIETATSPYSMAWRNGRWELVQACSSLADCLTAYQRRREEWLAAIRPLHGSHSK